MALTSIGDIRNLSRPMGIDALWVSDLAPPADAARRLKVWQESGHAGDLAYMLRAPEVLADARRLLPGARSLLIFAFHYSAAKRDELPPGHGRVARYAWGRDYHRVLKRRLTHLMGELESRLACTIQYRIVSDAVPLLERAYAERSGIGFIGRNSMLIRERLGSYFLLAEVVSDLEIEGEAPALKSGSCGSCVRCKNSCPTGAIVGDYTIDARRCISYLTIEKRGSFSREEREMLGEWLFGCDVCQEVCPFNHRAHSGADEISVIGEFEAASGAGQFIELNSLLEMRTDSAFAARFAGTPLMRGKRAGLLRNAAAVATNTRHEGSLPALCDAFEHDYDETVRQHALWALCLLSSAGNLGDNRRTQRLIEKALRDESRIVRDEGAWLAGNML